MIPLRNITACDHCGACCNQAPCLVGGYPELRTIVEKTGHRAFQVERTPAGKVQVRISAAPCVFYQEGKCQIHEIKPKGGREFECWNAHTYRKEYYWSGNQLRKIGYSSNAHN